MPSVLKKQVADSSWGQWIDGLHEALAEAKTRIASQEAVSKEWLESLMRSFHVIKGYAQALGLGGVQSVAHDLETRLVDLMSAQSRAFVPQGRLHLSEGELRALLAEGVRKFDAVLARLHEVQLHAAARRELLGERPRLSELFARIGSAAHGIAVSVGVELRFESEGADTIDFQDEWEAPLEAALLHAIRNSLDHGSQGVSGPLVVRLTAHEESGEIVIECQDRGAGIDPERVREAARERQKRFDAEMGGLSDTEVLQLLFLPGLSLSRGASRLSGRGFGLDIVREAIETRLRGRARIESQPGQGTRLILKFPARKTPISRS
jgi:chemotaxis protein histidine kinase CheA